MKAKYTPAAKESIDRLFAEPFEPAWMQRKRDRDAVELWSDIITQADFNWRMTAQKSRQSIARKCGGKYSSEYGK